MKLALFALSGLLAAAFQLKADVPPLINYQGFVTDANGEPIGAGTPVNRKVVFRIYDDANAGNRLWTEEHTVTLVDGQFSILLGAGIDATGTAAGESRPNIGSVVATGGERYIGLTVDNGDNTINGSDTEIAPRQRITSTAFALRAETADRVATNSDLYFTGDSNHGVGWYGSGRLFNGVSVDGPVLFGFNGGALGSVQGDTQTTALRWESDGDVAIAKDLSTVGLTATGNASIGGTLDMNGDLRMKGNKIYLGTDTTDTNHGLKYVSTYDGNSVDGPALFGFGGGVLGSSNGGERPALQWSPDGDASKVFVNGKLGVGVKTPSKALEVNGEMSSTNKATVGGLQVNGTTTSTGLTTTAGLTVSGSSELYGDATIKGSNRLILQDQFNALKAVQDYDGVHVAGLALYGYNGGVLATSGGTSPIENKVLIWKDNRVDIDGVLYVKEKKAAVGEEELRIVRGTIKSDGTIYAGSGFKVTKNKNPHTDDTSEWTGIFLITFDEAFSGPVTVTASPYGSGEQDIAQVHGWDVDDADGEDDLDFGRGVDAFNDDLDPQKGFRVDIRNSATGLEIAHAFTFIAIGPR